MKKYAVYGIGNALVDMEFSVEDGFLQEMNVEKGLMTLVDEERQSELLSMLRKAHGTRACGGSAANTIIAVSQLGGKSFYSCKVADDEMGHFYVGDLTEAGVDTNLRECLCPGITGKCLVMVTPDAERTMNTFLGITGAFSKAELVEAGIAESEYLYSEGYLVTSDTARPAVVEARRMAEKHGVKTAISFSDPSMVKYFKPGLEEILGGGVELLFCNEAEAKLFADTDSLETAADRLRQVARTFAVTLGARGALICDGDRCFTVDSHPVRAVDTNGAGDMFAGAFLYALTHGYSHEQAAELACLAASRVVQSFGPRLSVQDMQAVLGEFQGNYKGLQKTVDSGITFP